MPNKLNLKKPWSAGQVTVEALVAVSVLVVGFLGAFTLLSRSLFFNRVATDDSIASYLAAEGIEVAKNIVDSNYLVRLDDPARAWNQGFSSGDFEVQHDSVNFIPIVSCASARPLFLSSAGDLYSYSGATQTPFSRCLRVAIFGSDEVRVNSIVTWRTGLVQKSVNLEDRFFDWRP